jgi:hypothetical protein
VTDRAFRSQQREGEGGREPALWSSLSQPAAPSRPAVAPRLRREEDEPRLGQAITQLEDLPLEAGLHWRNHLGGSPPRHLPRWLLAKIFAYRLQAQAHGDFSPTTLRLLKGRGGHEASGPKPFQTRSAALREGGAFGRARS